jgi:hypothetical protein
MRNVFKQIGIIAFVAIIGFGFAALSLTGCGGGDDGGGSNPVMRTVTFDANGGTVEGAKTKAVKVEVGKTVKAPADPVYGSKKFWGWFDFDGKTEGKYGNRFNPETPITWDMTVFARWGDTVPPKSFDVTFDANGGKFADGGTTQIIQVYKDEKVDPPWATKNDGTIVSGWYDNAAGTGKAFDKDTPVTADLMVYAQWKKPEDMPDKDRWSVYRDPSSSATLDDYSIDVDDDRSCTVTLTVGGKPEKQGVDNVWRAWTVTVEYFYTGVAGKMYEYTFEAWTESGTRDMVAQYYTDNDDEVYLGETKSITTTPTTYTVLGKPLPKGGLRMLSFQCANQIGTVHIKILDIKEYIIGKLTITNFSGKLTQGMDVYGSATIGTTNLTFCSSLSFDDDNWNQGNVTIKGNTITIPVWRLDYEEQTVVPYTGNITVPAGSLNFAQWKHTANWEWIGTDEFTNKVPITFTSGNATIDFGTQMQKDNGGGGSNGGGGGGGSPAPVPGGGDENKAGVEP